MYDGWTASQYPLTQFQSTFSNSNYYDGAYFGGHFGPVSDFNLLQNYTLGKLGNFLDGYKTAQNDYPNRFNLIERISAGYLMNTIDFGKFRVMAGLRLEQTNMDTFGYNVTLYPPEARTVRRAAAAVPSAVDHQPVLHRSLCRASMRYALTRFGYPRRLLRGISRPDPNH